MRSWERVAGLLLAGGRSTRYGTNKLALPLPDGSTVGMRSLLELAQAVSGSAPVLVVTTEATWRAVFTDLPDSVRSRVRAVWADPAGGQGDSLARGIRAVRDETACDAVLVCLGDQPLALRTARGPLVSAFEADPAVLAVSASLGGTRRPPVVIRRGAFPLLDQLTGDVGGKRALQGLGQGVTGVDLEDGAWARDVDTPEAYQELLRRFPDSRCGTVCGN